MIYAVYNYQRRKMFKICNLCLMILNNCLIPLKTNTIGIERAFQVLIDKQLVRNCLLPQ